MEFFFKTCSCLRRLGRWLHWAQLCFVFFLFFLLFSPFGSICPISWTETSAFCDAGDKVYSCLETAITKETFVLEICETVSNFAHVILFRLRPAPTRRSTFPVCQNLPGKGNRFSLELHNFTDWLTKKGGKLVQHLRFWLSYIVALATRKHKHTALLFSVCT